MTAASARSATGIRFVRATVPLPIGVAWSATAAASASASRACRASNARYASTARLNSPTYATCSRSRRCAPAASRFAYRGVARSASSSARTFSTTAPGAHTPREKSFRPFFSRTVHVTPAAFTRRVSPASPGGNNTQSAGGRNTSPAAVRTDRPSGPGPTT
jgi:hypothetical protein